MRCLIVLLAGCAASSPLPAQHPAQDTATPGRLAAAPSATRANVVSYPDVPPRKAAAPVDHSHHHQAP